MAHREVVKGFTCSRCGVGVDIDVFVVEDETIGMVIGIWSCEGIRSSYCRQVDRGVDQAEQRSRIPRSPDSGVRSSKSASLVNKSPSIYSLL